MYQNEFLRKKEILKKNDGNIKIMEENHYRDRSPNKFNAISQAELITYSLLE